MAVHISDGTDHRSTALLAQRTLKNNGGDKSAPPATFSSKGSHTLHLMVENRGGCNLPSTSRDRPQKLRSITFWSPRTFTATSQYHLLSFHTGIVRVYVRSRTVRTCQARKGALIGGSPPTACHGFGVSMCSTHSPVFAVQFTVVLLVPIELNGLLYQFEPPVWFRGWHWLNDWKGV